MTEKFIYVFNETDKNTLLSHGYVLVQEPREKKAPIKKKTAKGKNAEAEIETPTEVREEVKYWVFANKSTRDLVFNSLEKYVFSNQLNL